MMIICLCLKFIFAWSATTTSAVETMEFLEAKAVCQSATNCGNITVPYPFATDRKCALSEDFFMLCNSTAYNPPRLFTRDLEVVAIYSTHVTVKNLVAFIKYNASGAAISTHNISFNLHNPYRLSARSNTFTSIGCDTLGFIQGPEWHNYTSGCVSVCTRKQSILYGSCSRDVGCCQMSIPKGLNFFRAYLVTANREWKKRSSAYNRVSYAFLADKDKFKFQSSDLSISNPDVISKLESIPLVLDWAIGNYTCQEARKNKTTFSCWNNTNCEDSYHGPGYRCRCKQGYQGNPYLSPGCQDINECDDPNKNACLVQCVNTLGSYSCHCPHGMIGDGRKNGSGCNTESKEFPIFKLTLGLGLGLSLTFLGSYGAYCCIRKRKLDKLKKKFFMKNGGFLLQQQGLSHDNNAVNGTKIFTAEELKRATNNYDGRRILGRGGNGTVYKGILPNDGRLVAIKKSKIVDENQIEKFINEVVILTQINHRNVVKLLGCCLETEVPLLVYEYISNGTLSQHIHHNRSDGVVSSLISWKNRLRIAIETAGALAYLHSAASVPIIHRDVKSANILLDDNYITKVADFGASRLVPLDQTQISTLVQGTLGYLDPQYFQSSQLTEKSDVYSFGVVLVELLTGEKPLCFERSEDRINLATYFIISMREHSLMQIVEESVEYEGGTEQLFAVAELALRCLNLRGEERPTMKQVLGELEKIRSSIEQHQVDEQDNKETTWLLHGAPDDRFMLSAYMSSGEPYGEHTMEDMMLSLDLYD